MVTKTPKNDKNVDTKQINDGVEEEASALRHSDGNVLNEQETTIGDDNHVETEGEISLSDDSSSDDEEEIVIKKAGARRSKRAKRVTEKIQKKQAQKMTNEMAAILDELVLKSIAIDVEERLARKEKEKEASVCNIHQEGKGNTINLQKENVDVEPKSVILRIQDDMASLTTSVKKMAEQAELDRKLLFEFLRKFPSSDKQDTA